MLQSTCSDSKRLYSQLTICAAIAWTISVNELRHVVLIAEMGPAILSATRGIVEVINESTASRSLDVTLLRPA